MATRTVSLDNVNILGERIVLQFNHSLDRFELVNMDDILNTAAEDGEISPIFVDEVEENLSVENIQIINLDGGDF